MIKELPLPDINLSDKGLKFFYRLTKGYEENKKIFALVMFLMLGLTLAIPKVLGAETTYYIIGSNVNGNYWQLSQPDAAFKHVGNGIYRWEGEVLGSGFKINDGTWDNPNCNIGNSQGDEISMNQPFYYYNNSSSGNIAFNGFTTLDNPVVELDINQKTITLKGGTPHGSPNWYIYGINGLNEFSEKTMLSPVEGQEGVFTCMIEITKSEGTFKISDDGWTHQYGTNDPTYNYLKPSSLLVLSPISGEGGEVPYSIPIGRYKIIFNLNDLTVVCLPEIDYENIQLYMIGSNVNGKSWELSQPDGKFTYKGEGVFRWEGSILASGFKVNDGTWDNPGLNIGASGNQPITMNTPYRYMAGNESTDIYFRDFTILTNPVVDIDLYSNTLTLVAGNQENRVIPGPFDFGSLYIIGDNINGNNWQLSDPSAKFDYMGNGMYEWHGAYMNSGFKINDGTWDNNVVNGICLNIGAPENDHGIVLGEPYNFFVGEDSGNMGFAQVSDVVNPLVVLNMGDGTLTVSIDGHTLQVNLPENASQSYKNCILELTDNISGTIHKSLVTDRVNYSFKGVKTGGDYTLRLITASNIVIGIIENFSMPGEDTEIQFDNLLNLYNIKACAIDPDGNDVTDNVIIEWFAPTEGDDEKFLKKSTSLKDIPEYTQVICKVTLDENLGQKYMNPEPCIVSADENEKEIVFQLKGFQTIELTGTVTDEEGNPIRGAMITTSLLLNDKYQKNLSALSGEDGRWTSVVTYSPTVILTFSAKDFVTKETDVAIQQEDLPTKNVGTAALMPLTGLKINYETAYRGADSEEFETPYSDYRNLAFTAFNTTQNKVLTDFSNQYPVLAILDKEILPGDEIVLTAYSKTDAFNPKSVSVTVSDKMDAKASFKLIGKGGIAASFGITENPAVISMLYDSTGTFLAKQLYREAKVSYSTLDDGEYYLVSMGQSEFINYLSRLNGLTEIGLLEGKDYSVNRLIVEEGKMTQVHIPEIPTLDEGRFYYTTPSSDFIGNKSSLTTGNFLTLSGSIDFKDSYKDRVSDVKMVIDLPEGCEFIEQSVIQGSSMLPYSLDINRLEIPLGDNYNANTVRFCVMPTYSGSFNASAYVSFVYDGQSLTQPLGAVTCEVKDIELIVPRVITEKRLTVKGKALVNSLIKIYWDGILMGTTQSNSAGEWESNIEFEYIKPFTLHSLYASIENESGTLLLSETKSILYDNDCPQLFGVEMLNLAHRYGHVAPEITYFDFVTNSKPKPYWYLGAYPKFTFSAIILDGEHNKVTDVTIYAYTEKGEWIPMKAQYNTKTAKWVASKNFNYGSLPVNVGVTYHSNYTEISPERLARLVTDSQLERTANSLFTDLNDYDVEESGTSLNFNYKGEEPSGMMFKTVRMLEDGSMTAEYEIDGMPYITTCSTGVVNSIPEGAEEYIISDKYSFYISLEEGSQSVIMSLVYPRGLITELLETEASKESATWSAFEPILKEYPNASNVGIFLQTDGIPQAKKYCNLCDYAENMCPDLAPMIDTRRRREANFQRQNQNLNNFSNTLDWVSRAAGFFNAAAPVEQAANVGGMAIELGQGAGNYIYGLMSDNYIAQLQGVGCLPMDYTPLLPFQGGSSGFVQDPSGYVYETVPSNRLEGVKASIYYKESREDIYGDEHEEIVLWNAEEYDQQNPLFTDENGMYQWDVPKGVWQVKFEKDGYETAYSEWLPVPPPQLDVNIGMTQTLAPEVISAKAYASGVEMEFSKYMNPSTLNSDNIFVKLEDSPVPGEIVPMNRETGNDGREYASIVKFVPSVPFGDNVKEVTLTVSGNVKSYAGICMSGIFNQTLDIEKEIYAIYADDVKVLCGNQKSLTVSVLPAEAAVGKSLNILNPASMIVEMDSEQDLTVNEDGNVFLTVKGNVPGTSVLTFSIDDVPVKGSCVIDVVNELITPEAPYSSRASGSEVYRGTKVELFTDTQNGEIYYTLDGSCPCDENGSRRKYTLPILIEEDTHILAITVAGEGIVENSETVEFNYKLKRNVLDYRLSAGWNWLSHSMESPIETESFLENKEIIRMKSQTAEAGDDKNPLLSVSAQEAFKVEAHSAVASLRFTDVAWNPATPITLQKGINWIGFPLTQAMSLNEALATMETEMSDAIVGQKGFAQYDGEKWIGTLEVLTPGEGYIYYSNSEKELLYNVSIVSKANAHVNRRLNSKSTEVVDIYKYEDVMPVVALIQELVPTGESYYEVYAYCGDECRGVSRKIANLEMMNVYGNPDDLIRIVVKDIDGNVIATKDAVFDDSRLLGDIYNPILISIDNENAEVDFTCHENSYNVQISGNSLLMISGDWNSVESIDILTVEGMLINRVTDVDSPEIRINPLARGIYILRIEANGIYYSNKVIVK